MADEKNRIQQAADALEALGTAPGQAKEPSKPVPGGPAAPPGSQVAAPSSYRRCPNVPTGRTIYPGGPQTRVRGREDARCSQAQAAGRS